jgi:hypothetical protein
MLVYFNDRRLYKLQIIIRRKLKIKHCVTEGQCILFSTQFSNVWTGQEIAWPDLKVLFRAFYFCHVFGIVGIVL